MYTIKYLQWKQQDIKLNGDFYAQVNAADNQECLTQIYHYIHPDYPKFFKMDVLSKLAFLATEIVNPDFVSVAKDRTAVVLSTREGCIDVDHKFEESRQTIASPALFVYTLPNIMLGEICIRHKLKGAQMCLIEEHPNPDLLYFYVSDLLTNRKVDACLCGRVEAWGNHLEATLAWVGPGNATEGDLIFNPENLNSIFT